MGIWPQGTLAQWGFGPMGLGPMGCWPHGTLAPGEFVSHVTLAPCDFDLFLSPFDLLLAPLVYFGLCLSHMAPYGPLWPILFGPI